VHGRDFAATSDVIFTSHGRLEARQVFHSDVKARSRSMAAARPILDEFVQRDARDGFILVPHLTPGGLDRVVAEVVLELQDRGSYRTEYPSAARRDLGLRHTRKEMA
jgi:hypothetical protein